MTFFKKKVTWVLAVFFFLCLVPPVFSKTKETEKDNPRVVVIVKKGGLLNDISLRDIQSIYLGEKLFVGKNKIIPLLNSDEEAVHVFFSVILRCRQVEYKKAWAQK